MSARAAEGVSALEELNRGRNPNFQPIPTFVQTLDTILNGGIQLGTVVEICGDSGLGKTAMCYQLCLDVQIPRILQGLEGQALYIDTENAFFIDRMSEMAKYFVSHCSSVIPKGCGPKLTVKGLLSNIHVLKCGGCEVSKLETIMLDLERYLSENDKIKLLVIDSISFPFYGRGDGFKSRSKPLYSISQVLQYLAAKCGIAIVLTNNVTARKDQSGQEYFVPFLGESWSHIPTTRVNLEWGNQGRCRVAEIVKSSSALPKTTNYRVTAAGVRD